MKTKDFKQVLEFNVAPIEVYNLLMNSKKHAKFTGAKARINKKVGGTFSSYAGYASGRNLEVIPAKKIVQSWHAADWPDYHNSKVYFIFEEKLDENKNIIGTKLKFMHEGIPEEQFSSIRKGWEDYYFKPMQEELNKK